MLYFQKKVKMEIENDLLGHPSFVVGKNRYSLEYVNRFLSQASDYIPSKQELTYLAELEIKKEFGPPKTIYQYLLKTNPIKTTINKFIWKYQSYLRCLQDNDKIISIYHNSFNSEQLEEYLYFVEPNIMSKICGYDIYDPHFGGKLAYNTKACWVVEYLNSFDSPGNNPDDINVFLIKHEYQLLHVAVMIYDGGWHLKKSYPYSVSLQSMDKLVTSWKKSEYLYKIYLVE